MKNRMLARAISALTLVGAVVAIAVPAQAHLQTGGITRSCGYYWYSSSHTAASTEEQSGTCAGDSWVRTYDASNKQYGWYHAQNYIGVSSSGSMDGKYIKISQHKGCETCDATEVTH